MVVLSLSRVAARVAGAVAIALSAPISPALGHDEGGAVYRWASPPAAAAADNVPPVGLAFAVHLDQTGSSGGLFATPDGQASVILQADAFAASPGQTSVQVTIDPLPPASVPVAASLPDGVSIAGNVYRIAATYVPGGAAATELRAIANLTLAYPPSDGPHSLIGLVDGQRWRPITAVDTPGDHVSGGVRSIGYFAVGTPAPLAAAIPIQAILASAGLGALVLAVILGVVLRRRAKRARGV